VLSHPGGPGKEGTANKTYVGKDAQVLLTAIGLNGVRAKLLFADVGPDDPFVWTEQLMPAIPLVRVKTADDAIAFAHRVEGGRRHTAVMHSRNIEKLSAMARAMDCSIFVKNGPAVAGIGEGGEGHTSFTIASPTGEGVTSARSFVRRRRCTLVDYFRIV
jgi:acyl-CoA reductase-like NAD-dependent aldehyde dehydrogenase